MFLTIQLLLILTNKQFKNNICVPILHYVCMMRASQAMYTTQFPNRQNVCMSVWWLVLAVSIQTTHPLKIQRHHGACWKGRPETVAAWTG